MNKTEFEEWLRVRGYRPVAKVDTPKGDLLIAEGSFEFPEPHIRTLWLVDGPDPGLWGRHVNHREYEPSEDGVFRRMTRQQRVEAAIDDAIFCLSEPIGTA